MSINYSSSNNINVDLVPDQSQAQQPFDQDRNLTSQDTTLETSQQDDDNTQNQHSRHHIIDDNISDRQSSENENFLILNSSQANVPIGVKFFGSFFRFSNISAKRTFHKSLVLCVTFIAYLCFHMGRRPLSIVKTVLNRDCSKLIGTGPIQNVAAQLDLEEIKNIDLGNDLYADDYSSLLTTTSATSTNNSNWCDWAPFDNDATAGQLLGELDSAFLFSYAFFMFISGYVADRCNLRYFLSSGLILSGVLLYIFGAGYYFQVHNIYFFIIVQIISGIVQTSGWPAVIACIGNWFDTTSRGSVFGIWNANTYLGNILGAAIAGYFVENNWGLSFMVPGFLTLMAGAMVFLFLVPRPEDVHLSPIKATHSDSHNSLKDDEYGNHCTHRRQQQQQHQQRHQSVIDIEQDIGGDAQSQAASEDQRSTTHRSASKRKSLSSTSRNSLLNDEMLSTNNGANNDLADEMMNHSLMNGEDSPLITPAVSTEVVFAGSRAGDSQTSSFGLWNCIMIPGVIEFSLCLAFAKLVSYTFLYWLPKYISQNTSNNSEESAYMSVPFDIGGIIGAITAGYLSDKYKKSGIICSGMLLFAIPSMFIYEKYASISNAYNIMLQLITGILVNGPYALITTAISADLGSRVKGGKAMATVAAILDGCGSIGAAIGPLLAGRLQRGSDSDWHNIFIMLMASDMLAILCLTRMTLRELGLR